MNGYIKLHRSMLDWEWFTDPITAHVWMYCLLRANYQPARWRGETLMPGQFITSLSNMAKECGITKGQLRTALNHLKSTQNITQSSAQHATLITVEKWGEYQCAGEKAAQLVAQKTTSRQHLDNISSTTDKEYKKEKEREENREIKEREFVLNGQGAFTGAWYSEVET